MNQFDFNTTTNYSGYQEQPINAPFAYNPQYPAASYDPRLFGHPHETAPIEETDPFWYQYPQWAQPQHPLYYYPDFRYLPYPLYLAYDMDHRSLIIGSGPNSQFARKNKEGVQKGNGQNQNGKPRQPRYQPAKVDVYYKETFLATVPLKQLTRFFIVAAEAFPRPKKDDVGSDGGEERSTKSSTPKNKVLVLGHKGVIPPNIQAFVTCFDYMHSNRNVRGSQPVYDFPIPEGATDNAMVNVYSAALALKMRPFPLNLERTLCQSVTQNAPTKALLEYFYERLPESPVLTRTLTSVVDYWNKYTDEERKAFNDLASADEYLDTRFIGIQRARDGKQRRAKKQEEHAKHEGKTAADWQLLDKDVASEGDAASTSIPRAAGHSVSGKGNQGRGQRDVKAVAKEKSADGGEGSGKEKVPEKTKPKAVRWAEAERKAQEIAGVKVEKEPEAKGNGKGVESKDVPGA